MWIPIALPTVYFFRMVLICCKTLFFSVIGTVLKTKHECMFKLCSSKNSGHAQTFNEKCSIWLAKWCKIHKVYIHLHSMLLLLFMNIFIHIQQPNLHSRNIFIHIYRCVSYSRLYLLTRDVLIHIQRVIFIHIHDRNIHSAFSVHHLCASLGPSSRSTISEHNMANGGRPKTYDPRHKCYMGQTAAMKLTA